MSIDLDKWSKRRDIFLDKVGLLPEEDDGEFTWEQFFSLMVMFCIGIILLVAFIIIVVLPLMDTFKPPAPAREFSYSEFTISEDHQINIGDYQAAVELSESGATYFLDISQGDEFINMISIPMLYVTFLETQTEDLGFYFLVVGDTGGVYVYFYDLEQEDDYVVPLEKEVMDELIAKIDLNRLQVKKTKQES